MNLWRQNWSSIADTPSRASRESASFDGVIEIYVHIFVFMCSKRRIDKREMIKDPKIIKGVLFLMMVYFLMVIWLVLPALSSAFQPSYNSLPTRRWNDAPYSGVISSGSSSYYTHLSAATSDNDDIDNDDIPLAAAQDLRSLVTQRCIQSFMFLLACKK